MPWVCTSSTPRSFDAIFDALFIGRGDDVHKPAWLPDPAHDLARARLRTGGLLVSNTLDEAPHVARSLGAKHPRVVQIEIEGYDNRVLTGGPKGLDARGLRQAIAESDVLRETLSELRVRTIARR